MRVLVIGSGMAGTAAALSAKAAGAEVTVIAAGTGATAFTSGTVWPHADVRGARLEGFHAVAADARLANVLGEVHSAAHALEAQARGAIRPGCRVGIVGLRGAPQLFDAGWAAEALRAAGIDAVPLELSLALTAEQCRRSPFEWAHALETAAEQQRWAEGLARLPRTQDLLLLPPVLGFDAGVLERLRAAVGRDVGELAATTPSVPGLRLNRLLEAKLRAAECAVRRGEVQSLSAGQASLSTGETLKLDRAVLATGRFLGGGLRRKPHFAEPLLGLSLALDGGPAPLPGAPIEALTGDAPGVDAPAFRLGVAVDEARHPLTANGEPLAWLFAAGSVLAGPERGLAFAWASGTAAGKLAAGQAAEPRRAVESAA